MTDKSEKFRDIPAIRGMLADPMRTSRKIEEFGDKLSKKLDEVPWSNNLMISNDRFSDMLSDAIRNNQREYDSLSDNIENLWDTYEDIWWELQSSMYDAIDEIQWIRKQMQIKNDIAKKSMEQGNITNTYLDNIDQGIDQTNRWINYTNRWIDHTNSKLGTIDSDMNQGFNQVWRWLNKISWWIEDLTWVNTVQYGSNVLKKTNKNIIHLAQQYGRPMKKTLMALFAKNYLQEWNIQTLSSMTWEWHPGLEYYLNLWMTSNEVENLKKQYGIEKNVLSQMEQEINNELSLEKLNKDRENLFDEKARILSGYEEKYKEDKGIRKNESLSTRQSIEVMKMAGNSVKDIVEKIKINGEEIQKAKIRHFELDQDIKIRKQTLQLTDEEIELIDIYQKSVWTRDMAELTNRWLMDENFLEILSKNMELTGEWSLELVHRMTLDENWVNPTFEHDGDVGRWQQLKAQTIQWNISLRQRWFIIKGLENIGDSLQQTNKWIANIHMDLQQTNEWIDNVNINLEYMNNQLGEANEYLFNLVESGEETNSLLIEGNQVLGEWNELSRITNQILVGIGWQIVNTWMQITEVLENIGDAIVVGFNQTLDVLQNIQEINQGIQFINQEMLQELYKQSSILLSIDQRLTKPLDIQANEYFMYGTEMLGTQENPSKQDRIVALESFENWLKLRNTHFLNLYGAWTALRNLGKEKRAAAYLERAYKFAKKPENISLAKTIAMDIAKIYIKYLELKIAKHWLDEVIVHDIEDLEAYLLKARITNVLDQKEEFKGLLDTIYHKIIEWSTKPTLTGNYQDVLKYLYKPATDLVDQHIQKWVLAKLLNILPSLQSIWHKDAVKTVISSVLFHYPQKLFSIGIDVQAIISNHKDYFLPLYQEYADKKFAGWNSKDFFAVAYLWYGSIDFDYLDRLIAVWFEYDLDYIALKNDSSEKNKVHKTNLQNKIYALWPSAKYMLRDYLKNHPDSLLI